MHVNKVLHLAEVSDWRWFWFGTIWILSAVDIECCYSQGQAASISVREVEICLQTAAAAAGKEPQEPTPAA